MPPSVPPPPHDALRAAMLANARPPLGRLLGPSLGPYRGYAEVLAALERLAQRGARLEVIGRSVRGEPIFAVHLGSTHPGARTAAVLSAVHPIEWIGVEVHLALLERLSWVDLADRAIVSVPVVNPDGFLRVEGNLRAGRRRFVRHNAHGVDLNRNFDARWSDRGLAQRLLSFLYASGSHPASEPEVEAVAHALSARRVDRGLSLHSFGGAVLYPSAATVLPVFDAAEQRAWAKRVAGAADARPYRALPASWFSWGMTQGGLDVDWFHERHGAVSLLVECSRGGVGILPSRLFQPFAWFNPKGVDAVAAPLSAALSPFVRGAALSPRPD